MKSQRKLDATQSMRPLEESLPLKLLKAREAVMEQFRPLLNEAGVTEQQWRVLRALVEHERMDAGDLARLVCIRMPSLSRIIRDLEGRELISKHRSQKDRRQIDVCITRAGRSFFKTASRDSEKSYATIEKSFGQDRLDRLMQELDALVRSMPKH